MVQELSLSVKHSVALKHPMEHLEGQFGKNAPFLLEDGRGNLCGIDD